MPRANYTVEGVTDANLAPYCRDSITRLLEEVPEITGLTFRVHVEGGIAEGDYGFWEEAFAGVAAAGRPVEIDMHGKGLDHKMIDIARNSGMPVAASPKYLAEHMGLPYHQSAIRNKEYPPEVAAQRARAALRGLAQVPPLLLWRPADQGQGLHRPLPHLGRHPAGAALGRPGLRRRLWQSSMFAGSDGVEWCEPQSFKGRMGTGIPGQRFTYQKHGMPTRPGLDEIRLPVPRLGPPALQSRRPARQLDALARDRMRRRRRALRAGPRAREPRAAAITLPHGPSASNNHYWPEIYTNLGLVEGSGRRAYAIDMEGAVRFGNAPTFDSALFATAREYAELLLAGKTCHRYTPLDVADWLRSSPRLRGGADPARSAADFGRPEVQRITADVQILAGIARYFAERFRAACWASSSSRARSRR